MPQQVCMGALLACSFGAAPSSLVVLPTNRVFTNSMPAATIMDHIPLLNILPFGMCNSPSNPAVIAATAAALGVFTPMPCIPVTPAPWTPGTSDVLIANMPSLNNTCSCNCIWAGMITISQAGQVQTQVS